MAKKKNKRDKKGGGALQPTAPTGPAVSINSTPTNSSMGINNNNSNEGSAAPTPTAELSEPAGESSAASQGPFSRHEGPDFWDENEISDPRQGKTIWPSHHHPHPSHHHHHPPHHHHHHHHDISTSGPPAVVPFVPSKPLVEQWKDFFLSIPNFNQDKIPEYAQIMLDEEVRLIDAPTFTDSELKEIGIVAMGARKAIMNHARTYDFRSIYHLGLIGTAAAPSLTSGASASSPSPPSSVFGSEHNATPREALLEMNSVGNATKKTDGHSGQIAVLSQPFGEKPAKKQALMLKQTLAERLFDHFPFLAAANNSKEEVPDEEELRRRFQNTSPAHSELESSSNVGLAESVLRAATSPPSASNEWFQMVASFQGAPHSTQNGELSKEWAQHLSSQAGIYSPVHETKPLHSPSSFLRPSSTNSDVNSQAVWEVSMSPENQNGNGKFKLESQNEQLIIDSPSDTESDDSFLFRELPDDQSDLDHAFPFYDDFDVFPQFMRDDPSFSEKISTLKTLLQDFSENM